MEKGSNTGLNFRDDFPPVSTRDWKERILEDLQGRDYEKEMVWETHDQFRIRPFYRKEDLEGKEYLESLPGQFPYLRGSGSTGKRWLIRLDIPVRDVKEANRQARELLERGVTSLGFDLRAGKCTGQKEIQGLLEGMPLEELPVNFITEHWLTEIPVYVHRYALRNGMDPELLRGSVSLDPLGKLTCTGNYHQDPVKDFRDLANSLGFARENLPGFRLIHVNGSEFHDSGASIGQELAFSLAKGNEYLVKFKEAGVGVSDILPHLQFQFSVGSSYFMEIARLRAARFLWSRILEAYTGKDNKAPAIYVHCVTSGWNQTLYDPHVNLLRGTSEAMSAILGGADSLTVTPFNRPLGEADPVAGRMARNTQVILGEESYLDRVMDPGAGSYYIENLTDTLISGAWNRFLQVEEKGGFESTFSQGYIQEEIRKTAGARRLNLATRNEILLGTNQYPIPGEKAKTVPGRKPVAEVVPAEERIAEPLERSRAARDFEQLRRRTEELAGNPPVVFIIPLGNLAMRRARAMFTLNFFSMAGFKVVDNIGKFRTVKEGTEAARKAGADIVVLCSSDEEYPEMASGFVSLAKDQSPSSGVPKAMIPVLAGYPGPYLDKLKEAGIEHFIHQKSNVLEELAKYQTLLGISSNGRPKETGTD